MNFDTWDFWFLFKQFQSLPIGGKIAFVSGHILVLLVIMLYATSTSQRHMPQSLKPTEQFVHTISTYPEQGNLCNTYKGLAYLLKSLRNRFSKYRIYYQTENKGDNPTHNIWCHIRTILNKLRRRVNESGKEPSRGNLTQWPQIYEV